MSDSDENLFGISASFLTLLALVPLLKSAWETRATHLLAYQWIFLNIMVNIIWSIYGMYYNDKIVFTLGYFSILIFMCLLYMKIRFESEQRLIVQSEKDIAAVTHLIEKNLISQNSSDA